MFLSIIIAPVQVTKEKPRKENDKDTKAKKKVKPKKEKVAAKQDDLGAEQPKKNEPETRRIEVLPANSEDSFWDFYEKPFPLS